MVYTSILDCQFMDWVASCHISRSCVCGNRQQPVLNVHNNFPYSKLDAVIVVFILFIKPFSLVLQHHSILYKLHWYVHVCRKCLFFKYNKSTGDGWFFSSHLFPYKLYKNVTFVYNPTIIGCLGLIGE